MAGHHIAVVHLDVTQRFPVLAVAERHVFQHVRHGGRGVGQRQDLVVLVPAVKCCGMHAIGRGHAANDQRVAALFAHPFIQGGIVERAEAVLLEHDLVGARLDTVIHFGVAVAPAAGRLRRATLERRPFRAGIAGVLAIATQTPERENHRNARLARGFDGLDAGLDGIGARRRAADRRHMASTSGVDDQLLDIERQQHGFLWVELINQHVLLTKEVPRHDLFKVFVGIIE